MESKTKKLLAGVTSVAMIASIVGCQNNTPALPDDSNCDEWEWDDDDGVYECDETTSSYYGHYFYGGSYYSNKASLLKSPSYQNYKNSSSFKGGKGFGSGSSFSGG
ncbi:aminotransferase yhxA [Litchfieldia salsa]|uniref:Aminotransferase yhxA n=1 Tax=Litchfieldia salsa TaxID=930152 RepID=A0A1H0SUM9_9BACI|nr:aminotransferase yhxA [Litchfieldia salsa]SDP45411.1 hypothetical protein SAMN05216565_103126 [Litchfieldia salsa]